MSFSTVTTFSERLTADQERDMATKIRQSEEKAYNLIKDVPIAAEILSQRPDRVERTRAGAVDRLENAIKELEKLGKEFVSQLMLVGGYVRR